MSSQIRVIGLLRNAKIILEHSDLVLNSFPSFGYATVYEWANNAHKIIEEVPWLIQQQIIGRAALTFDLPMFLKEGAERVLRHLARFESFEPAVVMLEMPENIPVQHTSSNV